MQRCLVADGLAARRLRRGPGFPLAGRDVRVPPGLARAAPALRTSTRRRSAALRRAAGGAGPRRRELVPGVTAAEVIATFRAAAAIQRRFGEEACHRYVISFTRSAGDVLRVLDLAEVAADPSIPAGRDCRPRAGHARAGRRAALRIERRARRAAASCLRRCFRDPRYRRHLAGARQPPGGDARLLRLEQGVRVPGRGLDAVPGPGPPRRSRAPARRRADALPRPRRRHRPRRRTDEPRHPGPGPALDRRPLQDDRAGRDGRGQLRQSRHRRAPPGAGRRAPWSSPPRPSTTNASTRSTSAAAAAMDELADLARRAYRSLVYEEPGFERFFRAVTPLAELSTMALGSRPARRGAAGEKPAATGVGVGGTGRTGAASGASARRRRASTRCGPSRGSSPGRRPASGCRPGTGSVRRSKRTSRPTARARSPASPSCTATGRS